MLHLVFVLLFNRKFPLLVDNKSYIKIICIRADILTDKRYIIFSYISINNKQQQQQKTLIDR